MSSRTPVRCENSCSTPSILTQVGVEPALDIILNLRKLVTPQNRKMLRMSRSARFAGTGGRWRSFFHQ